jgi:hypothetical protein
MSKTREHRQTKKARSDAVGTHDALIVELVKLLARSAAERDYEAFSRGKSRRDNKPEARRGE